MAIMGRRAGVHRACGWRAVGVGAMCRGVQYRWWNVFPGKRSAAAPQLRRISVCCGTWLGCHKCLSVALFCFVTPLSCVAHPCYTTDSAMHIVV